MNLQLIYSQNAVKTTTFYYSEYGKGRESIFGNHLKGFIIYYAVQMKWFAILDENWLTTSQAGSFNLVSCENKGYP